MSVVADTRAIGGWVPAADRRQRPVSVLEGRNFIFNASGVASGYGSDTLYFTKFPEISCVPFVIDDSLTLYFGKKFIYVYDEDAGLFKGLYEIPLVPYKLRAWSFAFVGGYYYFCLRGEFIIKFDSTNMAFEKLSVEGLMERPEFCTSSNNRLVVVGDGTVQWSAFDNGTDFVTDVDKGVGAQSLFVLGPGKPLALISTPYGFVIYTSSGVLKAEVVDAAYVFRFSPVANQRFAPVTDEAIVAVENKEHIILTKTGFYKSDGRDVTPWQEEFGEYLHQMFTKGFNGRFLLSYDPIGNHLYVSVTRNKDSDVFEYAYVLYIPAGNWGIMNHRHTNIATVQLFNELNVGLHTGYFGEDGQFNKFTARKGRQQQLGWNDGTVVHPQTDGMNYSIGETLYATSTIIMAGTDLGTLPSSMGVYGYVSTLDSNTLVKILNDEKIDEVESTIDDLYIPNVNLNERNVQGGGFFDIQELSRTSTPDAPTQLVSLNKPSFTVTDRESMQSEHIGVRYSIALLSPTELPLDSAVTIGPVYANEYAADKMTYAVNIVLGTQDAANLQAQKFDCMQEVGRLDCMKESGRRDCGKDIALGLNFVLNSYGSLDASAVFGDVQIPSLVRQDGQSFTYSMYQTGLYHNVTLSAYKKNEYFNVKTIAITLNEGGRL